MPNQLLLRVLVALGPLIVATAAGAAPPNLTGTYNVATLTPLQRPEEFGDNLYLTPERANQIMADAEARRVARSANRGPVTEAPPEGGAPPVGIGDEFRETSGAGNVGGYNDFWVDPGSEVFMVDGRFRTSIILAPKNGRMPQMTPVAMKSAMERRKLRRPNDGTAWWVALEGPGPYDGPESLGIAERCILGFTGTAPTFPSLYNNYKRIVQTDNHVMIFLEMVHDARVVRMNGQHPPANVKKWLGDSIGRWDGETLVIDTANFHPQSRPGYLGSENARVEERFTRLEGGDLLYRFTVDDPTVWEEPWTGEYVWRATDDKVYEYACHEGNYSMGGILRGARLLEAEAMSGEVGGG